MAAVIGGCCGVLDITEHLACKRMACLIVCEKTVYV
jgi:hypothetical protein